MADSLTSRAVILNPSEISSEIWRSFFLGLSARQHFRTMFKVKDSKKLSIFLGLDKSFILKDLLTMHFLYIVGLSGASRPDLIGEASGLEPSGPDEVLLSKVGQSDRGDRRRV